MRSRLIKWLIFLVFGLKTFFLFAFLAVGEVVFFPRESCANRNFEVALNLLVSVNQFVGGCFIVFPCFYDEISHQAYLFEFAILLHLI